MAFDSEILPPLEPRDPRREARSEPLLSVFRGFFRSLWLKKQLKTWSFHEMWVAILPLVALCRGQETQQALSGLLEAAGSVQSSSESFGSSVGSAKTIADYPQEVKEARQCMLDLFPLLTTSLETIALIPFAPLQTGARGAKTVMEAGKTTFESSTKLIPTVATAAEGVSRQMQTLQSTATKASLAITVFKAIVTRRGGVRGILMHFKSFRMS